MQSLLEQSPCHSCWLIDGAPGPPRWPRCPPHTQGCSQSPAHASPHPPLNKIQRAVITAVPESLNYTAAGARQAQGFGEMSLDFSRKPIKVWSKSLIEAARLDMHGHKRGRKMSLPLPIPCSEPFPRAPPCPGDIPVPNCCRWWAGGAACLQAGERGFLSFPFNHKFAQLLQKPSQSVFTHFFFLGQRGMLQISLTRGRAISI